MVACVTICLLGSISFATECVQSVTLNPATVAGGGNTTATITLTGRAPAGGLVVQLATSGPVSTVSSATVPANARAVKVVVSSSAVAVATSGTLMAYSDPASADAETAPTATVTVNAPTLKSLTSTAAVKCGVCVAATATLTSAAPEGGVTVTVTSDNPVVSGGSITIPAGKLSAAHMLASCSVNVDTTVHLTASLVDTTKTSTSVIKAPQLTSVKLFSATVAGGKSTNGAVLLSFAAPAGGQVVTLSSDNAAAVPDATVTVPAGLTSATFHVATTGVPSDVTAQISATTNGVTKSSTLTIAATVLNSVAILNASLLGGEHATGTVKLTGLAPAGGFTVQVTSDNVAVPAVGTVTVPEGTNSATFDIPTNPVVTNQTVNVIATNPADGTSKQKAMIVRVSQIKQITLSASTVIGGDTPTGTVTLKSSAPAGGFAVALSSSDSHATVPSTVTVAEGATTATFSISTTVPTSLTSATILGNDSVQQASTVLKVRPTPGTIKWSVTGGASGYVLSVASDGTVYSPTVRHIYALNPADGSQKWDYDAGSSANFRVFTTGMSSDNTVYGYSYSNSTLYAISSNGSLKWSAGSGIPNGIYAKLAVDSSGNCYVGGQSNGLKRFDSNGNLLSSTSYNVYTMTLNEATGKLYGSSSSTLFSSNLADTSQQWSISKSLSANVFDWPGVGIAGQDTRCGVFVYDRATGTQIATKAYAGILSPTGIWLGPSNSILTFTGITGYLDRLSQTLAVTWHKRVFTSSVYGALYDSTYDAIYVTGNQSMLVALNSDGTTKWSCTLGGSSQCVPVQGPDGTIYINCSDGKVYAINP